MSAKAQRTILESLSAEDRWILRYDWEKWARPSQLPPPGDWRIWLLLAGRGFGKTRAGAEWVRRMVETGAAGRIALVARTELEARQIMVEGASGLLAVCPPRFAPHYQPSRRQLTWPNGAIATSYSSDAPDQLRGPQHDAAWADELASWLDAATFDNLVFGLRLGADPRIVITTTPRPTALLRRILADPQTVVTHGATYENAANLPPALLAYLQNRYEGTALGRQELHAELLEGVEGALWQRELLAAGRVQSLPGLQRVVVAVDPAATAGHDESHGGETGIIVAGRGADGHGYVLDDLTLRGTPDQWARQAIAAYHKWRAARIIAEVNHGGDMIEYTLRTVDRQVAVKQVRASRGKQARAEPIVALYEQGKIHHVGVLARLEDQMVTWVPGQPGPDRIDALVWALSELMLGESRPAQVKIQPNPFYR